METPDPTTPEPSPSRRRSVILRIVALAVVAGVAWSAFNVSIPIFYAYLPGPVRDVEPLIEVDGVQTYSSEGVYLMTTVSVDTAVTFSEWVEALIDRNEQIILKEDLVPQGTTLQELEARQKEEMAASKQHAQEVAFSALGLGRPTGDGARVVQTVADYPADGILRKGDVIVKVDGANVQTTCDVGEAIDNLEIGDKVMITVRRNGEIKTLQVETGSNPQDGSAPFIGVHMSDVNYSFETDFDVTIKTGNIAGPSAGLMFTLALYDLLEPGDLTGGRKIAGTGEIACDGGVEPIGGIAQKVAGAEREGAEIFLAPAANYSDALEAAGEIEVVKVSNFAEAVEYLEGASD